MERQLDQLFLDKQIDNEIEYSRKDSVPKLLITKAYKKRKVEESKNNITKSFDLKLNISAVYHCSSFSVIQTMGIFSANNGGAQIYLGQNSRNLLYIYDCLLMDLNVNL